MKWKDLPDNVRASWRRLAPQLRRCPEYWTVHFHIGKKTGHVRRHHANYTEFAWMGKIIEADVPVGLWTPEYFWELLNQSSQELVNEIMEM